MATQFKVGDRVRVAVRPTSALHGRHAVGYTDVVTYAEPRDGGCQVIGFGPGASAASINFHADQFELVVPDEWLALPDGTVAQVVETTVGGAKKVGDVYYDPVRLTPAAAPKPLSDVPTDADTMLRMIDVFLARQDGPACDLQCVLAALRGPDESSKSKASTTVPIRRAALPECAKRAAESLLNQRTYMDFNALPFVLPAFGGNHFEQHIHSAVDALARMGRKVG